MSVIRILGLGLLLISWLTAAVLQAQPLSPTLFAFEHIQREQGLSNNFINCFYKDRNGFLWIGTADGLNRFDGTRFTIFRYNWRVKNSLANNSVWSICQDLDGNLWIGTNNGVSRFNPTTGQFTNIKSVDGRLLALCGTIICDRRGDIWFSSLRNGLFCYRTKTQRLIHYQHSDTQKASLSSNWTSFSGLREDPYRMGLWVSTDTGLNYLDVQSGQCHNYRNNPDSLTIFNNHYVTALAINDKKQLLFSDNGAEKIVVFDLSLRAVYQNITLKSQTGKAIFPLAAIFPDKGHNLWISSRNYALLQREEQTGKLIEFWHEPAQKASVSANFFWSAWQHDDGSIWLGTPNGISYTNPSRRFYQLHDIGQRLPSIMEGRGLRSFVEDSDSSWWFTTSNHLLVRYDPIRSQASAYPFPSLGREPEALFGHPLLVESKTGQELYVAIAGGVFVFSKATRRFTPLEFTSQLLSRITRIDNMIRRGDDLWFFSLESVAIRYHIPTKTWREYPIPLPNGRKIYAFRYVQLDKQEQLWINIDPTGFYYFSDNTQRFTRISTNFPPEYERYIYSFIHDDKQRLWAAVIDYGLLMINKDRKQFRLWGDQEGLTSARIGSLCQDPAGQIWVGVLNQISVFNPTHERFYNVSLPLNESDQEYETRLFPLRNGNLLAALKGYVVDIKPQLLHRKLPPTQVLISTLRSADTTRLIPDRSVQLSATDTDFGIGYSILTSAQQSYKYMYKLEGYDDDWVKADFRKVANYTKIPGGDYLFRVKAVEANAETPETTLAIHIDTAFYNTRWFRSGLLLLILTLTYWFYRHRVQQTARLHHLQMQASRLERDKTEIQYQNLINHLNPHFLFNSLTSLGSLILIDPKQASNFLQKLSTIYRYILQNKEKETVSLASELAFVQHYVELQQAQFEDGLQISIEVTRAYLSYEIVPVTLQNLFENAIKHNTTEEDQPLQIRVYVANEYLWVANNLQRKPIVKTSNKQGLDSLKKLYTYLSDRPLLIEETAIEFVVKVPLL